MTDLLDSYGWSRSLESAFERSETRGWAPARVIETRRASFLRLIAREGTCDARLSGRYLHESQAASDLPVVGDWVAFESAAADGIHQVHAVLPRRTLLSRKVAGTRSEQQAVAANVDLVLLVMGLDGDFNLRRLERFLVMASESGAEAALVLNKADLLESGHDSLDRVDRARALCQGAPVVVASALHNEIGAVELLLEPRKTVVFLGSSGVGKSTLINVLRGSSEIPTAEVRSGDSRGRHTTTHRELFRLPNGALAIDSPGVREIQLWGGSEGLSEVFDEIDEVAAECRFSDCRHQSEPGCAVRMAIDEGRLDRSRLESRQRLEREVAASELRLDQRARREQGRKNSKLYRAVQVEKRKRRGD